MCFKVSSSLCLINCPEILHANGIKALGMGRGGGEGIGAGWHSRQVPYKEGHGHSEYSGSP